MKSILIVGILFLSFSCNENNQENNSNSAKKSVNEISHPIKKENNKKKIYLTFDDGPTVGSKKLYELFKQEQVPVTLYLVGEHYQAMPGLQKDLDSLKKLPFVVLANHSYSHAWHDKYLKFYSNTQGVIDDYTKAQNILGITSGIARCAGRNVWRTSKVTVTDDKGPATAIDSLYKMGYQFTGWDRTWPYNYKTFKNTKDVAGMFKVIKLYFDSSYTKLPNHIVILGHDQQFASAEGYKQLKDFIDSIKASNIYEFKTMAQYPGIIGSKK